MPEYTWDEAARQFRERVRGRFVPRAEVERAVDAVAAAAAEDARALTARLAAGSVDLADWQRGMADLIRRAHLATATVARGGRDRMGPEQFGAVGRGLRDQYGFLRDFARELGAGLPIGGDVLARAAMYGNSARGAYHAAFRRDQVAAGYTQERRVLAATNHCPQCLDYAARGWVAAGTLPGIGQDCDCRTRCACRFEVRRRRRTTA